MSEDVRPFEEYKEMIKDMRKEEMIKGLYDLSKNITEKGKEIERLNNIINELEEYICAIEYDERHSECWEIPVRIHNKLKELKGSDKE